MKKIILLFVMMLTVAGVQAKTDKYNCNVTFTDGNFTNYSYNTSTDVFSWTQPHSNSMKIFNSIKGNVDLSNYKYLVVKPTNLGTSQYRIIIYCDNNGSTNSFVETYSDEIKIDLTKITLTTSGHTYANINNIFIAGSGGSGSLTIKEDDIYLETEEYEVMTITTTLNSSTNKTNPFQWYTYTSTDGKKALTSGNLYRCQFETAGIKEILSNAGSKLGYGSGFFDVTGYDNVTVNIDTYDNTKADQIRLLQATGDETTTNFVISVAEGATKASISALTPKWFSGIYSKQYNDQCQAIASVEFTKEFAVASTSDFNIAASTSSTINYGREFSAGTKATVCLPFSLDKSEMDTYGTFYYLESVSSGNLVFKKASNSVSAYTPYIFVPKSSGKLFENLTAKAIVASSEFSTKGTVSKSDGAWVFKGTLAHVNDVASANSSNTVYGWSSTDGTFKKAGTGVSIDAFRAYIIGPANSSSAKLTAVLYDDTTGIEVVKGSDVSAKASDAMYNLQGQRVGEGHKGLVIKNGKKIFLK